MTRIIPIALILLISGAGCHRSAPLPFPPADADIELIYLDSLEAAQTVALDRRDRFFEHITPADMQIQLRKIFPASTPRDSILLAYRQMLRKDVRKFRENDKKRVDEALGVLWQICKKNQIPLFPDSLKLIKTAGKYYGEFSFYTREKAIILPASPLSSFSTRELVSVLAHELAHIYTRYHREKKQALYALIGFEPIRETVQLPESVGRKMLLNPDGVSRQFGMRIPEEGNSARWTIPLVTAHPLLPDPEKKDFFDYVRFQMYPLKVAPGGQWLAEADSAGDSRLSADGYNYFHRRIGDNTGYIIHPDEIVAENIRLLILGKENPRTLNRLSEEGLELLKRVEKAMGDRR